MIINKTREYKNYKNKVERGIQVPKEGKWREGERFVITNLITNLFALLQLSKPWTIFFFNLFCELSNSANSSFDLRDDPFLSAYKLKRSFAFWC